MFTTVDCNTCLEHLWVQYRVEFNYQTCLGFFLFVWGFFRWSHDKHVITRKYEWMSHRLVDKLMEALLENETDVEAEITFACIFGSVVLKWNEGECSLPESQCVFTAEFEMLWERVTNCVQFPLSSWWNCVHFEAWKSLRVTNPPHVMGIFLVLLQIKHMMAFIEQEANEKAEEIEAKVKPTLTTVPLLVVFLNLY